MNARAIRKWLQKHVNWTGFPYISKVVKATQIDKSLGITSNQKVQFSELEPLSLQIYEGGPPSAISGAAIQQTQLHQPLQRNTGFDLNR